MFLGFDSNGFGELGTGKQDRSQLSSPKKNGGERERQLQRCSIIFSEIGTSSLILIFGSHFQTQGSHKGSLVRVQISPRDVNPRSGLTCRREIGMEERNRRLVACVNRDI